MKAGLGLRLVLHILSKHFLCLPSRVGFTLSCIVLIFRYTCPFVEKFSIDIETYYKTDPGENVNVFNLSPAEKRQTILGEYPFSFTFSFILLVVWGGGEFFVCPLRLSLTHTCAAVGVRLQGRVTSSAVRTPEFSSRLDVNHMEII